MTAGSRNVMDIAASQTATRQAPAARATHVRWAVIGMLAVISGTTYMDRLNLGIAGKYIQDEFAFSNQTMGWILSAFVLGYALFQVPGGWAGDKIGPRRMLTFAIVWWSVFTALTALAPQLPLAGWFSVGWSFAVVRFLIGMGESAAYPNSAKIVSYWSAPGNRGAATSVFIAGLGVGGALSPLGITWVMLHWGWRASFFLCAALGGIVSIAWHLYARDHPEDHPRVNAEELKLINRDEAKGGITVRRNKNSKIAVPWRAIFKSRSAWALVLSYFFIAYPAYIYYTWFFIYLMRVRGLSVAQTGLWGSTPFVAIILLAPVGGWLSDRLVARIGVRGGRRYAIWIGVGLSAIMLPAGGYAANDVLAILLLAGASGFNLFATTIWWAACNDITPNFSGSLSGLMNMSGNLGGWLSPILTAAIFTRFGWNMAFDFAGLMTLAAGLLWVLVRADETLE
ncbi:MAG TPA: MFS transporter [Terriglobia bacterium]|nr:MFS transporter [Terriglobia bacterium]